MGGTGGTARRDIRATLRLSLHPVTDALTRRFGKPDVRIAITMVIAILQVGCGSQEAKASLIATAP